MTEHCDFLTVIWRCVEPLAADSPKYLTGTGVSVGDMSATVASDKHHLGDVPAHAVGP